MNNILTQRNVKRIIDRHIYNKFGLEIKQENEVELINLVSKLLNEIQTDQYFLGNKERFYYELTGISLKTIAENYECKHKEPNESMSTKLLSPDFSQRKQLSPKFLNVEDSSIWSPEHQINVLLNTGTHSTNGMIRGMCNTVHYTDETNGTIGIYDTNTKINILTIFLNNPDCNLFELTASVRKYLESLNTDGFNQLDIIKPIVDTILQQPNGTNLNRNWFETFGFIEFLDNVTYTDISLHFTKCKPIEVKHLYNTLATVMKSQSDMNLLSSDFSTFFQDDIYDGLGEAIRNKLLNSYNGLSEPLFVKKTNFYHNVYKDFNLQYDSKDLYYLESLPLYFFDLKNKKFDYDRTPSFDDKIGVLLWGVGKQNKFNHIYESFNCIHSLKGTERYNTLISEWKTIILELHQLWTYFGDKVAGFEKISTSTYEYIAKKIKDTLISEYGLSDTTSPLNKPNISKLYDLNHDGSSPMTTILLNTFSFIKRTSGLSMMHGEIIFDLIPKYYKSDYFDFLQNAHYTKTVLEDKLKDAWAGMYPTKSLPSTLNLLYEISGGEQSIGSDGIIHIHNQFYNKVLVSKIQNDPIFKAMASEQKTKGTFLKNCSKEEIDYESNPILMTTHGLVKNYGNASDNEYLNIGHFKMRKDGGLVYVLKSNDDSELDNLKFLPENVLANQRLEKNVQKNYELWWDKQIRYNNYLFRESYQKAKVTEFYDEKCMEGDGNKFYYTHNIENFKEEERIYFEYKNAEYLQNNIKKIVKFMDGIDWHKLNDYENVNYIVNEELEILV